jgi:hypothetical protein
MEDVSNITRIIYYIAMSIAGPLAVIAFLQVKKTERLEKEYRTYDELDNRFFEYQKLALEYYDLDILDVPNNDPSLAFDKKRKQEMVAYAILFSLFERAYLMFSNQADTFRERQWSGWKRFLNEFIRRENVRTAWQLSKETYDTDFQAFMDRKIAAVLTGPAPAVSTKSPLAPLPSALPIAAPALEPAPVVSTSSPIAPLPNALPVAALDPPHGGPGAAIVAPTVALTD